MIQLILHLLGDYVLQSHWMAINKRTSSVAAGAHVITYSLPFLMLSPSWLAFSVIIGTHFLIDRFGLARFVVWAKNVIFDPDFWQNHNRHIEEHVIPKYGTATGYPSDTPPFLAVWLLIACDNTLHLAINYAALRWL